MQIHKNVRSKKCSENAFKYTVKLKGKGESWVSKAKRSRSLKQRATAGAEMSLNRHGYKLQRLSAGSLVLTP